MDLIREFSLTALEPLITKWYSLTGLDLHEQAGRDSLYRFLLMETFFLPKDIQVDCICVELVGKDVPKVLKEKMSGRNDLQEIYKDMMKDQFFIASLVQQNLFAECQENLASCTEEVLRNTLIGRLEDLSTANPDLSEQLGELEFHKIINALQETLKETGKFMDSHREPDWKTFSKHLKKAANMVAPKGKPKDLVASATLKRLEGQLANIKKTELSALELVKDIRMMIISEATFMPAGSITKDVAYNMLTTFKNKFLRRFPTHLLTESFGKWIISKDSALEQASLLAKWYGMKTRNFTSCPQALFSDDKNFEAAAMFLVAGVLKDVDIALRAKVLAHQVGITKLEAQKLVTERLAAYPASVLGYISMELVNNSYFAYIVAQPGVFSLSALPCLKSGSCDEYNILFVPEAMGLCSKYTRDKILFFFSAAALKAMIKMLDRGKLMLWNDPEEWKLFERTVLRDDRDCVLRNEKIAFESEYWHIGQKVIDELNCGDYGSYEELKRASSREFEHLKRRFKVEMAQDEQKDHLKQLKELGNEALEEFVLLNWKSFGKFVCKIDATFSVNQALKAIGKEFVEISSMPDPIKKVLSEDPVGVANGLADWYNKSSKAGKNVIANFESRNSTMRCANYLIMHKVGHPEKDETLYNKLKTDALRKLPNFPNFPPKFDTTALFQAYEPDELAVMFEMVTIVDENFVMALAQPPLFQPTKMKCFASNDCTGEDARKRLLEIAKSGDLYERLKVIQLEDLCRVICKLSKKLDKLIDPSLTSAEMISQLEYAMMRWDRACVANVLCLHYPKEDYHEIGLNCRDYKSYAAVKEKVDDFLLNVTIRAG
jgi:hypothetical protein